MLSQIVGQLILFGQFSLLGAMSVFMSVCLCVCAIAKHLLPEVVETSGWIAMRFYWPAMNQFFLLLSVSMILAKQNIGQKNLVKKKFGQIKMLGTKKSERKKIPKKKFDIEMIGPKKCLGKKVWPNKKLRPVFFFAKKYLCHKKLGHKTNFCPKKI